MPQIDFHKVRREIPMEEVLSLVGFHPAYCRGDQWYGPCPFHEPSSHPSPSRRYPFSVNVVRKGFYCHKCGERGDQVQLWATYNDLRNQPAAIDLCQTTGREVPWIWDG